MRVRDNSFDVWLGLAVVLTGLLLATPPAAAQDQNLKLVQIAPVKKTVPTPNRRR